MNQSQRRIYLIESLLKEREEYHDIQIPENEMDQKSLLRALINVRLPKEMDAQFLSIQNAYLQEETKLKHVTKVSDLTPIQDRIYLWQGDITALECDAIVNAANSGMTGCYIPNHTCIDNCIHTYAGIQLRLDCDKIIKEQGHEEETGKAKITKAYNLPCQYVLHTVGPIIQRKVTKKDCELLRSCYWSCLELADQYNIKTIAFCCISTGVFHFPNDMAAQIAVDTVKEYQKNSEIEVIFNVFKDQDKFIYQQILGYNQ